LTVLRAWTRAAGGRPTEQLVGVAFVALSLCALMALQAPGHMSYDSLVQLDEGFTRKYHSWNPPGFSLFLGQSYALFGGTAGALLISQVLLLVATYRLAAAPSAPVALRLCAFVSVLAVPIVIIYAGILWKDVFFAHLALMGFAVLQRDSGGRKYLFRAALLLGAAATVRQQGLVLLVPLLGYALWLAGSGAGSRTARWQFAIAALSGFFAAYIVIDTIVKTTAVDFPARPYETGVRLIQYYDIAGVAYREPEIALDELAALPAFDRGQFLSFVQRGYSPERIDHMDSAAESFAPQFTVGKDDRVIDSQWRSLVIASPLTYLEHRLDVFSWMLGRHDPTKCSPYIDLVSGDPPGVAERYGLKPGFHPAAHSFTPRVSIDAFRPYLFLAGGSLAALALLAWRWRQPRQRDGGNSGAASRGVIPALFLAALLYASVHFIVGIACDFRYLYFPVLASIITIANVFWEGFAKVFVPRSGRGSGD